MPSSPTWQEGINTFSTTTSIPASGVLTNDVQIDKNNPAVEYIGTEANALYHETREVAGDFWVVTNAQFNGTNWIPQSLTNPVYAEHYKANGQKEHLFCAAGVTPVVWTTLAYTDPFGALVLTPQAFTANTEFGLSLAPIWNAGAAVMTAMLLNVTNTASGAGSRLLDLQVGSVSQFNVDVNGNVFDAEGYKRKGLLGGVPVDGNAAGQVTYGTAFPNATDQVFLTIQNDFSVNSWDLLVSYSAPTTTGFKIWVTGGPTGNNVSVSWRALGH